MWCRSGSTTLSPSSWSPPSRPAAPRLPTVPSSSRARSPRREPTASTFHRMAGWGDDPKLDELRTLIYEQDWTPVKVVETRERDTVTIEKDGERREIASDHIAF